MNDAARFEFTPADSAQRAAGMLPLLPLILSYRGRSVTVSGLLDTGAAVNVLPYRIGVDLGAVWEQQTTPVQLGGSLAPFESCVLIASAGVSRFAPVRLAFAWTRTDDVPLILGQVNFFMEFDVCFYRSQLAFEVRPR